MTATCPQEQSFEDHTLAGIKTAIQRIKSHLGQLNTKVLDIKVARSHLDRYNDLQSKAALKADHVRIILTMQRLTFIAETLESAVTTIEESRMEGEDDA